MNEPKYLLICNTCQYKFYTDASEPVPLTEIKFAQPPLHADGKRHDNTNLPRRFKCPRCGYVVKIVRLVSQDQSEEKNEGDRGEEPKEPK